MEDTLSELFTQCWGKLLYGSFIAGNAFSTGIVGTQTDGGIKLRTVVLRAVDPDEKKIIFYTDNRSAKMAEIESNPALSWLFYDAAEKIQVRLAGNATMHQHDDVAKYHWDKLHAGSRRSYLAIPGPSTPVSEPADGLEYLNEDSNDTEAGYNNFAVIITEVDFIEWLHLKNSGHRRAQFKWIDKSWKGQWLIP